MNQQTSATQDPLAQLQDIHLPAPIGIWPPAWGWWVLLILIVTAIALAIFFISRQKSRNAYRNAAIVELKNIAAQYSLDQQAEYLQAISILLRRTALSGFGALFNPSLKGESWLEWLDAQCEKTQKGFSQNIGRALLIGPYQKNPVFDRDALQKLVALWIAEHHNQWQQSSRKHHKPVAMKEAADHV